MAERKIMVTQCICERCGYSWIPRLDKKGKPRERPRICPSCKSAWWDTPRKGKKQP